MNNGSDGVEVDPAELRAAAGRVDGVFADANTTLTNTDREISDSSEAWVGTAKAAFEQFSGYVNARRDALLADLARLSDNLTSSANRYETQDGETASALVRTGPKL